MSVSEAAEHFKVSRSTIYRRIKRGELSAKKVNRRWVIELDAGESMSHDHETVNHLTPEQEARRQQQIADSAQWYDWEHYGPKEGWKVSNIKLTSMPRYWQDDAGNWQAEGSIGVNVFGEMLERPQYIEREEGYALRIDVEAIDWWYRFTAVETGQVHDVGWSKQELSGGLAFTVPRSPIWFLQDGQLYQVQAWARPRLRRARYEADVPRTAELWSSRASGIGESETGDTITASEVYCIQWHESQYEMLSWLVGAEKPVSHVPWYEAPIDQERLDWYNALLYRQHQDPVDAVPDSETRTAAELRETVEKHDADAERRTREARERQERNRRRREAENAERAERQEREQEAAAQRKAEYDAEQERRTLENNKRLFYQYFEQQGATTLEAKTELLRTIYTDPQWDSYDKAAEAVAAELGVTL